MLKGKDNENIKTRKEQHSEATAKQSSEAAKQLDG